MNEMETVKLALALHRGQQRVTKTATNWQNGDDNERKRRATMAIIMESEEERLQWTNKKGEYRLQ